MTLLSTNPDATDISSYVITSGIDSTYKLYIFKLININAATDGAIFTFDFSIDGGDNYDQTTTSCYMVASHTEADDVAAIDKTTSYSQHTGNPAQNITGSLDNAADASSSGTVWLFDPSNTAFMKQYNSTMNDLGNSDYANTVYVDGKIHTASAVNAVKFAPSSGNFDGVIKMYGVGA